MSRRPAGRAGRRLAVTGTILAVTALGGCFTGERPTLGPPPGPTGDANADAVLERLDAASSAAFDARYTIASPRGEQAEARVHQAGPGERTVTIGSVAFTVDGASTSTCDVAGAAPSDCADAIESERVSDLGVTPEFYAASAATRLRVDVARRVGATTASDDTIGGQPARCVTIPVADSQVSYCAARAGPLARLAATDVTIELIELTR